MRLPGIDAPEKWQAFGQVSKQHLSDLVYDKTVSVVFHKRDWYKRILGKVLVNGADAGIRSNWAWAGITRSTSASNPLRTGWPTLAPRRRLGQSGAVSGAIPDRCRRGSSAGAERCAADSPSRPRGTDRGDRSTNLRLRKCSASVVATEHVCWLTEVSSADPCFLCLYQLQCVRCSARLVVSSEAPSVFSVVTSACRLQDQACTIPIQPNRGIR